MLIIVRARISASAASKLRKLDDRFGLQSAMAGFERLYKDGRSKPAMRGWKPK